MPLDFPSSPTNGQEYQGYVYSTSVGAWQAKPAAQSPFYTSDTPPANPTKGDSWFNTNDGTMYVYVYDGNTYQWVEHRSQIARSQVGLVPIIPSSIAVGSGTGSVATGGTITYSGATSISLNEIFSSAYSKYRILFTFTQSSISGNQTARLRTTSDNTTANYGTSGLALLNAAGPAIAYGGTGATFFYLNTNYNFAGVLGVTSLDLFNPNLATQTNGTLSYSGVWTNGGHAVTSTAWNHYLTNQYTGLTILHDAGATFGGTIQVFGYNQ